LAINSPAGKEKKEKKKRKRWVHYESQLWHYHLSMKEGSLFCFVVIKDPLNWDALDCVLGVLWKALDERGAWAWFHDIWTCSAEVLEY
jgi:hypothetical protein